MRNFTIDKNWYFKFDNGRVIDMSDIVERLNTALSNEKVFFTGVDVFLAKTAMHELELLQTQLEVARETITRAYEMSERPKCLCGRPTGTAAIKLCLEKYLNKDKEHDGGK